MLLETSEVVRIDEKDDLFFFIPNYRNEINLNNLSLNTNVDKPDNFNTQNDLLKNLIIYSIETLYSEKSLIYKNAPLFINTFNWQFDITEKILFETFMNLNIDEDVFSSLSIIKPEDILPYDNFFYLYILSQKIDVSLLYKIFMKKFNYASPSQNNYSIENVISTFNSIVKKNKIIDPLCYFFTSFDKILPSNNTKNLYFQYYSLFLCFYIRKPSIIDINNEEFMIINFLSLYRDQFTELKDLLYLSNFNRKWFLSVFLYTILNTTYIENNDLLTKMQKFYSLKIRYKIIEQLSMNLNILDSLISRNLFPNNTYDIESDFFRKHFLENPIIEPNLFKSFISILIPSDTLLKVKEFKTISFNGSEFKANNITDSGLLYLLNDNYLHRIENKNDFTYFLLYTNLQESDRNFIKIEGEIETYLFSDKNQLISLPTNKIQNNKNIQIYVDNKLYKNVFINTSTITILKNNNIDDNLIIISNDPNTKYDHKLFFPIPVFNDTNFYDKFENTFLKQSTQQLKLQPFYNITTTFKSINNNIFFKTFNYNILNSVNDYNDSIIDDYSEKVKTDNLNSFRLYNVIDYTMENVRPDVTKLNNIQIEKITSQNKIISLLDKKVIYNFYSTNCISNNNVRVYNTTNNTNEPIINSQNSNKSEYYTLKYIYMPLDILKYTKHTYNVDNDAQTVNLQELNFQFPLFNSQPVVDDSYKISAFTFFHTSKILNMSESNKMNFSVNYLLNKEYLQSISYGITREDSNSILFRNLGIFFTSTNDFVFEDFIFTNSLIKKLNFNTLEITENHGLFPNDKNTIRISNTTSSSYLKIEFSLDVEFLLKYSNLLDSSDSTPVINFNSFNSKNILIPGKKLKDSIKIDKANFFSWRNEHSVYTRNSLARYDMNMYSYNIYKNNINKRDSLRTSINNEFFNSSDFLNINFELKDLSCGEIEMEINLYSSDDDFTNSIYYFVQKSDLIIEPKNLNTLIIDENSSINFKCKQYFLKPKTIFTKYCVNISFWLKYSKSNDYVFNRYFLGDLKLFIRNENIVRTGLLNNMQTNINLPYRQYVPILHSIQKNDLLKFYIRGRNADGIGDMDFSLVDSTGKISIVGVHLVKYIQFFSLFILSFNRGLTIDGMRREKANAKFYQVPTFYAPNGSKTVEFVLKVLENNKFLVMINKVVQSVEFTTQHTIGQISGIMYWRTNTFIESFVHLRPMQ